MGSRADDTVYDARHQHHSERRSMFGTLRRFAITVTRTSFWQGVGLLLIDQKTKETEKAEIFPGIGIYARPPVGTNSEGIVGYLGADAQNPVWLGVRDEDTRRFVMDQAHPAANETFLYNSLARLMIRKDGSIVVRFPGAASDIRLATIQDLNGLATYVRAQSGADGGPGHVHATPSGPTTSTTAAPSTDGGGPYTGTGPA